MYIYRSEAVGKWEVGKRELNVCFIQSTGSENQNLHYLTHQIVVKYANNIILQNIFL